MFRFPGILAVCFSLAWTLVPGSAHATTASAQPARALPRTEPLQESGFLNRKLELHGMRVGSALVSISFRRVGGRCHVDKLDVTGGPLKTDIQID